MQVSAIDQLVTVDELHLRRSLPELRSWYFTVQQQLCATSASRAQARQPHKLLKNFCDEVRPVLAFLDHEFPDTRALIYFPAEGADDAVIDGIEGHATSISIQIVTGFRCEEYSRRMQMLSRTGYAPAYGPVPTPDANYEPRAVRREDRIGAAAKAISTNLTKKSAMHYSHKPWLIVDTDMDNFETQDIDALVERVTSEATKDSFARTYLIDTTPPIHCRRLT